MFVHLTSALVVASLIVTQTPVPSSPAAAPVPSQSAATPAPASPNALPAPTQTITVPAGTVIPLTLVSVIKSKSTHLEDTVRAQVAFPVTVGSQIAIPAGTYVEGLLSQLDTRAKSGQLPFKIHFTRLIYSNGYSAPLSGDSEQAFLLPEDNRTSTVEVAELTPIRLPGARFAMGEGQTTTMPTVSRPGPSPVVVTGAMAGGAALLFGLLFWSAHRAGKRAQNSDYVLVDAGLQFQMTLDSPVVLDAAQVTAAAATPSTN
jgi:type IV secretion system protein VirB10